MSETAFHATTGSLWRTSFELDDGLAQAVFERLDGIGLSLAMHEAAGDGGFAVERWRVEIIEAEKPKRAEQRKRLRKMLAEIAPDLADMAIEEVSEADWTARMRQEFPPVEAGRFFVHGKGQMPPPGKVGIQIEAGLAFGSGEHATTKGCLLALNQILGRRPLRRVVDMGTGSGILAIAAAKAARTSVLAVDTDPVAVEVAAKNAQDNGVSDRVTAIAGDGFSAPGLFHPKGHDLIFANILANPLIRMAHRLERSMAAQGYAILAGLIDEQAGRVESAYRRAGLQLAHRLDMDRWVILTMRKRWR